MFCSSLLVMFHLLSMQPQLVTQGGFSVLLSNPAQKFTHTKTANPSLYCKSTLNCLLVYIFKFLYTSLAQTGLFLQCCANARKSSVYTHYQFSYRKKKYYRLFAFLYTNHKCLGGIKPRILQECSNMEVTTDLLS